jgi:hypothetical protein
MTCGVRADAMPVGRAERDDLSDHIRLDPLNVIVRAKLGVEVRYAWWKLEGEELRFGASAGAPQFRLNQ